MSRPGLPAAADAVILGLKPEHDGGAALIEGGRLVFSLEGEKDSFPRYAPLTPSVLVTAFELCDRPPNVIALGGWRKGHRRIGLGDQWIGAGYLGHSEFTLREGQIFGRPGAIFSSTHERSHIFMAAAMSPDAPLRECAIVLWEGIIGAIYHWTEYGRHLSRREVMSEPGARYGALFALAEPTFPDEYRHPDDSFAGKLMALAAYGRGDELRPDERSTVDALLDVRTVIPFDKAAFRNSPLYNCGVEDQKLKRAAVYLQDRLFDIFFEAALQAVPPDLPLLIVGGCGLNCDWNRRWADASYFSSVHVTPCTNDSGSAIGSAVDALVQLGGACALEWDVYSGAPFVVDSQPGPGWESAPLDVDDLVDRLAAGAVVAWVQGRCEIGPRALGHRSLLASPLLAESHDRLNAIKRREGYRPIAPCALREDLPRWFDPPIDDPYMLYFSDVRTDALPAVTHVDGTARVQSVGEDGDPRLRELLTAFRTKSGYGVLCNTSLNFSGRGFINRMSDLFAYCESQGITDVVVDDTQFGRD